MKQKYDFRILVIDDNPDIHNDFIKVLTPSKVASKLNALEKEIFADKEHKPELLPVFQIDTATQGREGVEKIAAAIKEKKPYALAFVDVRMPPGWDGLETIQHIWEVDKNIQVVICTAYSDYTWEETVSKLGQTDKLLILKKPFDFIAVRQLACALTRKWQHLQETNHHEFLLEKRLKEGSESLQQSLARLQATMESSTDGILIINNLGDIIDYNKKLISMWKIPDTIIKKGNFSALLDHLEEGIVSPQNFLDNVKELNIDLKKIGTGTLHLKNKHILNYYSQPQKLGNEVTGRVYSFRDVTRRTQLEDELQHQATHDSLTGLPNRVLLEEFIKIAIGQSSGEKKGFAVLFFDLDRFKLINDSLSHATGDAVLSMIAKNLQTALRSCDFVARLGGDEFVVVLRNIDDKAMIKETTERLLNVINKPLHIANRDITISTSLGISIYPHDAYNADMLLRKANAAMFKAKQSGANQYRFYIEDSSQEGLAILDKEIQLRQAITNNELLLYYQPQIDIRTHKLIGVEALLRWQHPTKGLLLPIDFIPIAEETGLIVPIGEWVLRTACKQNKAWQDAGLPPVRVAVNIAAQQLNQYNIVETIRNILKETGLHPEYLELELTENAIINNANVINTINKLKEIGIGIAVDDFGTGYSSLNYLKNLHLDRLKIDRSFVQDVLINRGDEVIIQAIITIAHKLHLKVIAEGVETKDQLNYLAKKNCGEIQGFYFSKPVSSTELELLLANSKKLEHLI